VAWGLLSATFAPTQRSTRPTVNSSRSEELDLITDLGGDNLDLIAHDLHASTGAAGWLVTATQLGYALGVLLIDRAARPAQPAPIEPAMPPQATLGQFLTTKNLEPLSSNNPYE
jgi:MFS family permease